MRSILDFTKKGLVLLVCFFSFAATAQLTGQARIDSLLPTLKTAQEDTSKVNLLVDLSFTWSNINTDEGLKYGNQALALAKKLNWKKGIAYSTMRLGVNYNNRHEDSMAIACYKQAMPLFEQLNDKIGLVKTLSNMGNAYYSKYELKEGLNYYLQALKLSGESGQKNMVRMLYDKIGLSYLYLSEGVRAKEFFEKAVKANKEVDDKPAMLASMMNILLVNPYDSEYLNLCKTTYAFAEELNDTANMVNHVGKNDK